VICFGHRLVYKRQQGKLQRSSPTFIGQLKTSAWLAEGEDLSRL
jgi:hypothetical protein